MRFDQTVPLPPGLTVGPIKATIEFVERELTDLVEIYFEQANVFSALVGIFATKALDVHSVYEKRRNVDLAQQRFPDLKRRGSGDVPSANESLEVKASKRAWSLQSHYNHPGWYMVFRYLVDPTYSFEAERAVIIWRVDVSYLGESDWKYEGSRAASGRGGRTHTFGLTKPAQKLRGKQIYVRSDVVLRGGKPVRANGI